jgi:hypothetical protein
MITYQGGKSRLAPRIADAIGQVAGDFVELCCGSGAVTLEMLRRGAVRPGDVTMVDQGPWGWVWEDIGKGAFPVDLLRMLVAEVPKNPAHHNDWLRSWTAFPASRRSAPALFLLLQAGAFGGKAVWLDGDAWQNTSFRAYWLPTAGASRKSPVNVFMPQPAALLDRVLAVCDLALGVRGRRGDAQAEHARAATVYVDPPYTGTTGYGHSIGVENLSSRWRARGARVYVSEARPLPGHAAHMLSEGEAKGGINGKRKRPKPEWLSVGIPLC